MKSQRCFLVCITVLLLLTLGAGAAMGAKVVLRAAHYFAEDFAWQVGLEKFADRVNELTNGDVEIRIFGAGVLGGEDDYFQNMMEGVLDFAIVAPGSAGGFSKQVRLLGVPFLWESREHWARALDGEVGEIMRQRIYEETDVIALEYWGGSERHIISRVGPVWTIDDLKNFKLRVMPDPAQVQSFEALGCSPAIVAYLETYSALQAGVIDGMENEAWTAFAMKFYEPAPYISLSSHDITSRPLFMSGKTYRKLPEAYQEAIKKAAREATVFVRELELEQNQIAIRRMIEEFNVKVNHVQRRPMLEATRPVREAIAKDLGALDVLELIEKTAKQ